MVRHDSSGFPPTHRIPQTGSRGDTTAGRRHGRSHRHLKITAATTRAPCLHHCTQVPVFIHLLNQIRYPQADILEHELTQGFRLMGDLQPGTNWYIRTDQKYLQPKSAQQFADHNQQYVHRKLTKPRVDDRYEFMLEEIVQEVGAGRMNGPYRQPSSWPTPTITPPGYGLALLPLPHTNPKVAMAFSIKQTGSDGKDKIRRGEDWRRSGHNSTCIMHDQPFHHTPDHFASLVMQTHQTHPTAEMHIWGHDHDGAYRQLPLDNPETAYVLLHTPQGPTLWSHNVLLFGSSASVWGYNRFGDAMVSVSRILLLCPTMHYVDDYGSTEITKHSSSGFQAFEDFNGALGYRMKPSKRQPPANTHKIQGVNITIEQQHIVLTPCPQRVERMCQDILACLDTNHLDPDMARRMAGKCNFLTGRLFGKVGRAPLKAIYARAHSHQTSLDKPTKAALYALLDIISHCRPMRIPREPRARHFPIIYTDAYYTADQQRLRPNDPIPEGWQPQDYATVDNGFGAVIFPPGESDRAWFFQGRLPKEILKQFSSNTAFIYLLEAWVALLAPLVFEPLLGDFYVQCCDNEAARHAIIKGVGKHQPLNALISAHCTWHNRRDMAQ